MTFYDKKDLGKIIGHYEFKDDKYIVEYLNGDDVKYYNSNKDHYKELNKKMLEQAKYRDKDLYASYRKKYILTYVKFILFAMMVDFVIDSNVLSFIMCIIYFLATSFKVVPEYRELKKYHNYLEIEEKLENDDNILKDFGYDEIYDLPLNINTLDDYPNTEINKIKKYILKNK